MKNVDASTYYWHRNLRLTSGLLLIWLIVTFGVAWFARELAAWNFFGWPFSFFMAAQGSLLVYVVIVWWYAHQMERLDLAADSPLSEGLVSKSKSESKPESKLDSRLE